MEIQAVTLVTPYKLPEGTLNVEFCTACLSPVRLIRSSTLQPLKANQQPKLQDETDASWAVLSALQKHLQLVTACVLLRPGTGQHMG